MKIFLFGKDSLDECEMILKQWLPIVPQCGTSDSFLILQQGSRSCCILDPTHEEAAAFAQKQGLDCLTCGFSSYDSLVLSSRSDTEAIITLQRQIHSFSGTVLEPGDRLIRKSSSINDHNLLLCCGSLLLAGILSEEEFFL